MPNWGEGTATVETLREDLSTALGNLRMEQEDNLLLKESLADLQLAVEDRGWAKLSGQGDGVDLPSETRRVMADNATMALIANPLIIRGMALRQAYIWGQGVAISVEDDESGQDVNAVVQDFLDYNADTFSGASAHEDIENLLGIVGEVVYCLPTNRVTGRVRVQLIDSDEITDIVTNPRDRSRNWYYRRDFQERKVNAIGQMGQWEKRTTWHPDVSYNPRGIDRLNLIEGNPVLWDQPIRFRAVNRYRRMKRGVGDIYPALAWSRTTKEVIEAWVLLFKALSRFAHKVKGDRVQQAAAKLRETQNAAAGQNFVGGTAADIEAISKSGALLDLNGVKWPAIMVANAFKVPLTMLLGDPGQTGARAVAETLDPSIEMMARGRQDLHREDIGVILDYVIGWAVKASLHPFKLRGSVRYEGDREIVELTDSDGNRVVADFPDYDSTPVKEKVEAIVTAHGTDVLPDEVTLAEILSALKVPNADKIIEANTDAEGRFIPLTGRRAEAQDDQARKGGTTGIINPDDEIKPEDAEA